jgi:CheY-like chemotaxis protein
MNNGLSILVVDDERILRDTLCTLLTREGYVVETATDGEDALGKLDIHKYDIIICDIKMPCMDGFELLKKVKETIPRTVVIMMTAFGDSYAVKDCLLLGADEYITKPFKDFEIKLVIERASWHLMSMRKNSPTC